MGNQERRERMVRLVSRYVFPQYSDFTSIYHVLYMDHLRDILLEDDIV